MVGPDDLTCPQCGVEVAMGFPRGASVEAVTTTPEEELEESFVTEARNKRRTNSCANEHVFYVYFSY